MNGESIAFDILDDTYITMPTDAGNDVTSGGIF
jgi:hypothetical protein